jgi:hypothetical protein
LAALPDRGDVVVFSKGSPALIFDSMSACFLEKCGTISAVGRFKVLARVYFDAGPSGMKQWQLCLQREGGPSL